MPRFRRMYRELLQFWSKFPPYRFHFEWWPEDTYKYYSSHPLVSSWTWKNFILPYSQFPVELGLSPSHKFLIHFFPTCPRAPSGILLPNSCLLLPPLFFKLHSWLTNFPFGLIFLKMELRSYGPLRLEKMLKERITVLFSGTNINKKISHLHCQANFLWHNCCVFMQRDFFFLSFSEFYFKSLHLLF